MNALKRFEDWCNSSKENMGYIRSGSGFAADCWEVTLEKTIKKSKIVCAEANFLHPPADMDVAWCEKDGNLYTVVIPVYDDERDPPDFDWDWPGLEATINHAIDCAEKFWPK